MATKLGWIAEAFPKLKLKEKLEKIEAIVKKHGSTVSDEYPKSIADLFNQLSAVFDIKASYGHSDGGQSTTGTTPPYWHIEIRNKKGCPISTTCSVRMYHSRKYIRGGLCEEWGRIETDRGSFGYKDYKEMMENVINNLQ